MNNPLPKFRKLLCAKSLIRLIHEAFSKVFDHRPNHVDGKITLSDALMSALGMMHLKYPTLLVFDKEAKTEQLKHNLKHLYHVKGSIPCDTHMWDILDPVSPTALRKPYKKLFAQIQRGGMLETFKRNYRAPTF